MIVLFFYADSSEDPPTRPHSLVGLEDLAVVVQRPEVRQEEIPVPIPVVHVAPIAQEVRCSERLKYLIVLLVIAYTLFSVLQLIFPDYFGHPFRLCRILEASQCGK